jgi:hypothetical protein
MVAGPTDPPFASRRSQTDNAGTRETSSAALQATASVSFGKRNFAARDWRALPASSPAQTRENSSSDCPQPQQAAEIARIFSKRKPPRFGGTGWWTVLGSNRGPHQDALWNVGASTCAFGKRNFARRDCRANSTDEPLTTRELESETVSEQTTH